MRQMAELFCGKEREILYEIVRIINDKNNQIRHQKMRMEEYQEFIEAWAHEVKTPLALMTFVMDNRQDEMSEDVFCRLQYSCTKIQEDVEKMLYYERIQSECTDYLYEKLDMREICESVIEEYRNMAEDRNICFVNDVVSTEVVTDARGLRFCLRQVVSNSIQYRADRGDGKVRFYTILDEDKGKVRLNIQDNGTGIKPYDKPFIFQKGFTGDKGAVNKTATGMGLYLTAEMAKRLKIEIAVPECEEGFEISFIFNL